MAQVRRDIFVRRVVERFVRNFKAMLRRSQRGSHVRIDINNPEQPIGIEIRPLQPLTKKQREECGLLQSVLAGLQQKSPFFTSVWARKLMRGLDGREGRR